MGVSGRRMGSGGFGMFDQWNPLELVNQVLPFLGFSWLDLRIFGMTQGSQPLVDDWRGARSILEGPLHFWGVFSSRVRHGSS